MGKLDIIKRKIHTRESIRYLLNEWKYFNKKIVFTNGCFDIVHLGHIDSLAQAADFGDVLVVGLNSDASVKLQQKAGTRPLQDERSRTAILAAVHFVDAVILFDEETPESLIDFLQPDVLVKGGDYKVEDIAGHKIVLQKGGEVKIIPLVPGYSTTAIEKKIKETKD